MALDITKTRTKRYVGVCGLGDCDYLTRVESLRVNASIQLRDHARIVHGLLPAPLIPERNTNMRKPTGELHPQEKLGDYKDHYVVLSDARPDHLEETKFGPQDIVKCLAYVYLADGEKGGPGWKALGDTPIFWVEVQKQLLDDPSEPLGGKLVKGTDRNGNEWVVADVPTSDKVGTKALKDWSKDASEPF